jgi:thiol-disulfide isomerase/thioredoxin
MMIHRRYALAAAAGTLAATIWPRKPVAAGLPSLAEGLEILKTPADLPDEVFVSSDGATHHLSEFSGHGMVVNMWATWCAPCVAEMPSLEQLSKTLAPKDIAVLPLSSDRGGADRVSAWYQQHDISALPVLLDPKGAMARAFAAKGIPTTVIINKSGKVVARLEGSADWSAAEVPAVIEKLTAG